jgi:excisionase family DNA binding protein
MGEGKEKSERRTLSVPEAGRILGLAPGAAYRAARNGFIPAIRIGGKVLVPIDALNKLLNETGTKAE